MISWQQLVAIASEAVLALLATLVSVCQTVKRIRSDRESNALSALLLSVSRSILLAELAFGDGHGEEKKEYALLKLAQYAASLDLDFSKYEQVCRDTIEDVLNTPQKKLED